MRGRIEIDLHLPGLAAIGNGIAAPGTVTSGVRTTLRPSIGERLLGQAGARRSASWMIGTVEAL